MALLPFDELNTPKVDVEPPEKYFSKMAISKEQKEERVETANDLMDVLLFFFALLAIEMGEDRPDYDMVYQKFNIRFRDVVAKHSRMDDYQKNYVDEYTQMQYEITRRHMEAVGVGRDGRTDGGWWTSMERAMAIGENAANIILNHEELLEAAEAGAVGKKWVDKDDNKVRKSHLAVIKKIIPLEEYFVVGNGVMLHPLDWDNNPDQCYNCRCVCHYFDKNGKLVKIGRNPNKDNNEQENTGFQESAKKNRGESTYNVDWHTVRSKEYTNRFNVLSDNSDANALVAKNARRALTNRDGRNTEELYAVDMKNGVDVSKIIDQHIPFGVNRTPKFSADANRCEKNGGKLLFIHNHPNNTPPSYCDLNELLDHANAVGITVGHKGSIYYYTKPNRRITKRDFDIAKDHFKMYNDETVKHEKALELMAKRFDFEFRIL